MNDLLSNAVTMSANPLVIDGLIVGKSPRGHTIFSAAGKAAAVQLMKQSSASVSSIAAANGINANLIPKWARSKGKAVKSARTAVLMPVSVKSVATRSSEMAVAIELPRGTIRLTVSGMQPLATLIDQLSGR